MLLLKCIIKYGSLETQKGEISCKKVNSQLIWGCCLEENVEDMVGVKGVKIEQNVVIY